MYTVLCEGKHDTSFQGTTCIVHPFYASCSLIQTEGKNIIVDTSSRGYADQVVEKLKELHLSPENIDIVFCTHYHLDHVFNAYLFSKADIFVAHNNWKNDFSNASNALTSNNQYATVVFSGAYNRSDVLGCIAPVGLSIPSSATIDGVEFRIEKKANVGGVITDRAARLILNGEVSETYTRNDGGAHWLTSDTYAYYGSSTDLWGYTSWTPSTFNSSFGLGMQVNDISLASATAYIDHMSMRVHYTESNVAPTLTGGTTTQSYLSSSNQTAFNVQCSGVTDPNSSQTITCQGSWNGTNWYTVGTASSPISNGTIQGTPNVSSWTGYPADGSRTMYVRVTDGVATSANRSFTVTKDTTAPTSAPTCTPGTSYFGATTGTISCTVGTGGTTIRYTTNGTEPTAGSSVWSNQAFTTTTTLKVISCDAANNCYLTSNTYTYTKDVTAPTVPTMIAEPAYTAGLSNTVTSNTVTDSGVGGVEYQYCRNTTNTTSGCTASGWTSSATATFSSLTDGQIYYYFVRARDSLGNTSIWSTSTFSTQDNVSPSSLVWNWNSPTSTQISFSLSNLTDFGSGIHSNGIYCEFDDNATTFITADSNTGWVSSTTQTFVTIENTSVAARCKLRDVALNESAWFVPTPAYSTTLNGEITIGSPNVISFPTTQVTNLAHTVSVTLTGENYFHINDQIGSDTGYTTTLQSSYLTTTGASIPASQISVYVDDTNPIIISGTSNPQVLINSDITAGYVSLNNPVNLLLRNSGTNNGITGNYGVLPTFRVTIPAYQYIGNYTGTLTYTLIE